MSGQKLATLAVQVGNAATAGFGLSLGRDIYHRAKPSSAFTAIIIILFACSLFLTVIGGMILLQGYNRGWIKSIFLTFGLSLLAIIGGFFVTLLLAIVAGDVLLNIPTSDFLEMHGGLVVMLTLGLTLVGMLIGLLRRGRRLRRFAAIDHNEAFLAENGFKETNGRDVTHYDPDGNPLRLLEANPDKLAFMVVGRRGRRAYIDLDDGGRMMSYSGIV